MKNYITDVEGIIVGHMESEEGHTGCTVVICEEGATGGVDVRGSAPGTRETDLLKAEKAVDEIHSVVLSGGSAFGLDAASGVMEFLEEKNIGFDVGMTRVPIVSSAVIFDFIIGDYKIRPDKEMGYRAAKKASKDESGRGNIGCGAGATVGKIMGPEYAMKGGLGSASIKVGELVVAALVSVNSYGDIYEGLEQIAGPYKRNEGKMYNTIDIMKTSGEEIGFNPTNTTIGIIATNAKITKSQGNKIAEMAHNGYARSINPVHTTVDGDTIFTMATNKVEADINLIGVLAAEVMEKAVLDGVKNAKSSDSFISYKDILKNS